MQKSTLPIRRDGDGHRHSYSYGYKYGGYGGYNREQRPRKLNARVLVVTIVVLAIGIPAVYFWHDAQTHKLSQGLLEYGDQMADEENWKEAADAYFRVWEIRRDSALLGKLAPAYDKFAVNHNRLGVIGSYQRAVGALPDRVDLRHRLAELLLLDGQNQLALEQAEKILTLADEDPQAVKWRALALLAQQRNGKPIEADVLKELQNAYVLQQDDRQLALTLAEYIRSTLKAPNNSELARMADAVIDRLVATDTNSADMYFVRYKYRVRHRLPGSHEDLANAALLEPNDPEIVEQAAWDALRDAVGNRSNGAYLTARELFTRLIELKPHEDAGYRGLGDTEYLFMGDLEQALEIWNEGREKSANNLPLLLRILEAQVNTHDYEAAEDTLAALDQLLTPLASSRAERDLNWGRAMVGLNRGKMLLAQDKPIEAIPNFQIAATLGSDPRSGVRSGKTTAHQALMSLGKTYRQLGRLNDAADAYERAATLDPSSQVACLEAAKAWQALGDLDRAVRHCETALESETASGTAHLHLAQILLEKEMTLPAWQRDWTHFEAAFDDARDALADSWQLRMLDVDYSLRKPASELSLALGKLFAIERDFPDNVELWRRLPLAYESIGQTGHANRALERLEELTSSSPLTKILTVDILLGRGQLDKARRVLETTANQRLTPFEQWSHDLAALRIIEADDDANAVDAELLRLTKLYPGSSLLVERLLDRRLSGASTSAEPSNESLLELLKQIQGDVVPNWQYYEARFELAKETPDVKQLYALLDSLQSRLPFWTRTEELAGRIELFKEDDQAARDAFKEAISLPSPNPALFRLLVRQFLADDDYESLWQLLDQRNQLKPLSNLYREQSWSQLRTELDFRHAGDAADLTPAEAFVWSQFGGNKQSTDTFRSEFPNNLAGPMLALYQTTDSGEQQQLLTRIESHTFDNNDQRAFVTGQALSMVHDHNAAIEMLQKVDESSAYRLSAELYASKAESTQRAAENETATRVESVQHPEMRLEAIMRLRRAGKGDLQSAVNLLSELVDAETSELNDRILLAQALRSIGNDAAAEQQLLLVAETEPTADHIAKLADALLESGNLEAARDWIHRLESQGGVTFESISLRARWLAENGRSQQIKTLVENFAKARFNQKPEDIATEMLRLAGIYRDVNMLPEAQHWLTELADRFPDKAVPLSYLMVDNSKSEIAIDHCLQQLERSPSASAATLLARILVYSDEIPAETWDRVSPVLEHNLERFPDNASLLFALGNLHLRRGDRPRAVELLNRVTQVKPGHFLALNNLAAILAEEPGRVDEAMETIDNAILLAAYEIPTLLDTKAVVLIHQGNYQAAADLSQAVTASVDATDPRYFFHLAMSLAMLGETDEARLAMAEAERLGLDQAFLTEFEKQQSARLRAEFAKL